jgi:hypothetical protein
MINSLHISDILDNKCATQINEFVTGTKDDAKGKHDHRPSDADWMLL